MDERKLYILGAILHSYINSAEPIGSRTLQRDFAMQVSPATIRNEMSDLEHLGFLMKAHTSSGRIPSDRAYRWYVDELLSRGVEREGVPALSEASLLHRSNELSTVVRETLRLLSDSTGLPAFALLPARKRDVLRRIELLILSPQELVIVYVYDTKLVRTDLIHLSEPYEPQRVHRAGEVLQQILGNRRLEEIKELFQAGLLRGEAVRGNLFAAIGPMIREEILQGLRDEILLEGVPKLYHLPEFGDASAVQDMARRLKNEELQMLLDRTGETLEVFIGEESGIDLLEQMTVVVAPYRARGNLVGRIGIFGPTRMEYRKVLADVACMARYLESVAFRG